MSKKESTFFNMVSTLVVIAVVSAGTLGAVYNVTKEPIAKAKLEKKLKAIKAALLEDHNNDPNQDQERVASFDGEELECYLGKTDDQLNSIAIRTLSRKGFSGDIWIMVGFLKDGSIHNIQVLDHKETPGLGTKMATPKFIGQFIGKHPRKNKIKVTKDGGEIDSITAATISSRAFCGAIERAYQAYFERKK